MAGSQSGSFKRTLNAAGRRVTGQRALLLAIIERQEGHLDAQELYELARQRDPRLSLSTVYRTLNLLRDLGLVDELHLGEEHHHYEIRQRTAHHHLICLGCGEVIEFSTPLAEQLKTAVGRTHDFEIEEAQIDLMGYCPRCRRTRAESTATG